MLQDFITGLRFTLIRVFSEANEWFKEDEQIRQYKAMEASWNVNQVLEHIVLTNHYLLLLIDKGRTKALKRSDLEIMLPEDLSAHLARLDEIGQHQSFEWHRPEHMEPLGLFSSEEVRYLLRYQLIRVLRNLEELKEGQGFRVLTTMTVYDLGKLDVYQYICFLAKHIERHITQMQKLRDVAKVELKNKEVLMV